MPLWYSILLPMTHQEQSEHRARARMLSDLALKNLDGPIQWPDCPYEYPKIPDGVYSPDWMCPPKWFELFDYWDLPENQDMHRPIHYGLLSWMSNRNMHAQLMGKRPPVLGGWHMYICRECGRLFTSRQAPHKFRRADCGCIQRKLKRQTVRLEGRQFGWLLVIEYREARGDGVKGGWECLCLGRRGDCQRICVVSTQRLLNLQTLGCEDCIAEDWRREPGRKPIHSRHGEALTEHRKRENGEPCSGRLTPSGCDGSCLPKA